jgi:GH15 family glucan-1,4-alpha-glucosidase
LQNIIEQYKDNLNLGIIGNCRTAALINKEAEIVWLCMPEFNSYSIFAKILDRAKGGYFGISSQNGYKIEQKYVKNTNILCTAFSNNKNCFHVYDFMPRYKNEHEKHHYPPEIIRYIKLIKGKPKINIHYNPQFCYAQSNTKSIKNSNYIKSYSMNDPYESMYLYSNIPFNKILEGSAYTIKEDYYLWISYNQKIEIPDIETAYLTYERTKVYWLDWCSRTIRFPRFKEEIDRSALVLKLLSFQKTGAILAAATTSIPEDINIQTKELLGNFPQGYSHLALINTAITLSQYKIKGN